MAGMVVMIYASDLRAWWLLFRSAWRDDPE
jgi:hypothetical protein